jgi:uncharacterized protein YpmB
MVLTVEIIIIIIAGVVSAAFLAWYFYSSSKKPARCSGCQAAGLEEMKEYLKQKQAGDKQPVKDPPVKK